LFPAITNVYRELEALFSVAGAALWPYPREERMRANNKSFFIGMSFAICLDQENTALDGQAALPIVLSSSISWISLPLVPHLGFQRS
jgi:hypothetical protein